METHILVVEDDAEIREGVAIYLKNQGYTVHGAANGAQGLELARQLPIHLAVVDVMMPVMDGLEATRTIRALDRADAASVPIIAMTANAFYEDAQKCLAAGMNAHLAKPLQIKKVKQTIAEWVKNNRTAKKDA